MKFLKNFLTKTRNVHCRISTSQTHVTSRLFPIKKWCKARIIKSQNEINIKMSILLKEGEGCIK